MDNYAQSPYATSASKCHHAASLGPGTFLKDIKFCEDGFQKKKLQGPKLKWDIFAGTSVIFKPKINYQYNTSCQVTYNKTYLKRVIE